MTRLFAPLLALLSIVGTSSEACSVHDHNCQFQGIGRAVNFTVNQNSQTQVVIGSVGSNAVDFDNHVLLPDGNGPYITSTLGYTPRSDQPYIGSSEQPRHIYPTQYQIDFQNGTAQAAYSGDVTGGAFIPNPGGCTIATATYCEEVRIIGNIPDPGTPEGFVVKQTNHLYNFPNDPNPTIDIISYGATTGQAYFKQESHLGYSPNEVVFNGQTVRFSGIRTETLSGTGDQGAEQTYYIGFDDFQAHAAGVVVHDAQRRQVASAVYDLQWGHRTPDGISQYSGNQRKDTFEQFDRVYTHSTDVGQPQITLDDTVTATWDVWSGRYNQQSNESYLSYQREQDRLASLDSERQVATGRATREYCSRPNGVCVRNDQISGLDLAFAQNNDFSKYGKWGVPTSIGPAPADPWYNPRLTTTGDNPLFPYRLDIRPFSTLVGAAKELSSFPGQALNLAILSSEIDTSTDLLMISNFTDLEYDQKDLEKDLTEARANFDNFSNLFEPNGDYERTGADAAQVVGLASGVFGLSKFGIKKVVSNSDNIIENSPNYHPIGSALDATMPKRFEFVTVRTGTHLRRTTQYDSLMIQINSGHGYNRPHLSGDIRDSGLSMAQVDDAIVIDIAKKQFDEIPLLPKTTSATIEIDGYALTYDITKLPNGNISVPTYYPGP